MHARVSTSGHLEHGSAGVDAAHPSAGSHLDRHLGGQEAGSHTDVQHLLAGLERERGTHAIPLGHDVGGGVRRLDPASRICVEFEHEPIRYFSNEATRAFPTLGAQMLNDSKVTANIPAADLDRARRFYADKLGLTPVQEATAA